MEVQKFVLWSRRSSKGVLTWMIYVKRRGENGGRYLTSVGQKRADRILEAAQL